MEVSIGRNFRPLSFKAQNIGTDFILNHRNIRSIIIRSHNLYEDMRYNIFTAYYIMPHIAC